MAHPEQLPVTLPDKQFPVGDINSPLRIEMADQWFQTVNDYDSDRLEQYLQYACAPKPQHGLDGIPTHYAALRLCDSWDYYHCGFVYRRAEAGYRLARAFQDATFFLPTFNTNLTEEIEWLNTNEHAEKGGFYGKVHKAQAFGRAAWVGMQYSHPNLHARFKQLLDIGHKKLQLDLVETDGEEIFIAGMMLPYMFACVSQMDEHVARRGYTGLATESSDE